MGGSRKDIEQAVEKDFPFLPAGCHLHLDPLARDIVLKSLRNAIPSRWPAKVDELRRLRVDRPNIDLAGYLDESGLQIQEVYENNKSWSDLLDAAGAGTLDTGPHELQLRRAVGRLLHIDDEERIGAYLSLLHGDVTPEPGQLPERERRLLRMLVDTLMEQVIDSKVTLQEATALLWSHPQVLAELIQILGVLRDRVDHVHMQVPAKPDVPLQVHARYTRREILDACNIGSAAKAPSWQAGVWDAKEEQSELLAFTLDKSSGSFSPTTRYRDYAITPRLIHWESQSAVRADSNTGLRYRNHAGLGRSVLLFARLRADDRAFWFLGTGQYRGHVGERPMAITWELDHPLPGDLFAQFAAAVA